MNEEAEKAARLARKSATKKPRRSKLERSNSKPKFQTGGVKTTSQVVEVQNLDEDQMGVDDQVFAIMD